MLPDTLYIKNMKYVKEVAIPIPDGYFLAQLGDDYAIWGSPQERAFGGNPAVVPLILDDRNDTFFTKDWQFYLVAINWEIYITLGDSSILALMGGTKAFMNGTGIGDGRNDYITGKTDRIKDPATDKFRSMCLNTHLCKEVGGMYVPLALDGNKPPPMKPGKPRPRTLEEIIPSDYLYHPKTHPWFFLDCNNVKWKPDTRTLDYGPFDKGATRDWMTDGIQHTFFPFVTSRYPNTPTPKSWWRKLKDGEKIPSAFRRG